MIELTPIQDLDLVMSFVKGKGVRKRVSCGNDLTDEQVKDSIDFDKNLYLLAKEDKTLGMVVVVDEGFPVVSLHLVLSTVGKKTREVFSKAIDYVKALGAEEIVAYFPKTYRAATKLVDEFGFKDTQFYPDFYFKSLKLI